MRQHRARGGDGRARPRHPGGAVRRRLRTVRVYHVSDIDCFRYIVYIFLLVTKISNWRVSGKGVYTQRKVANDRSIRPRRMLCIQEFLNLS